MMNKAIFLTPLLAMALLRAGAEDKVFSRIDASKLPAPAARQGVTFATDIKPLLNASCVRCHGPEKAKGGLRLDTLEGVLKGGEEGKVLAAGNSAKSLIVVAASQIDEETAMPPKKRPGRGNGKGPQKQPQGEPPKPLTAEQVGLLRAWIDQGAK